MSDGQLGSEQSGSPPADVRSRGDSDDRDFYEAQIRDALAEVAVGLGMLRDFTVDSEIVYMEVTKAQEWFEGAMRTLENALPSPYEQALRQ